MAERRFRSIHHYGTDSRPPSTRTRFLRDLDGDGDLDLLFHGNVWLNSDVPFDLAVSNTNTQFTAIPGQTTTYSITVVNNGPGDGLGHPVSKYVLSDALQRPMDLRGLDRIDVHPERRGRLRRQHNPSRWWSAEVYGNGRHRSVGDGNHRSHGGGRAAQPASLTSIATITRLMMSTSCPSCIWCPR